MAYRNYKIMVMAVLVAMGLLIGGCTSETTPTGVLEGTVTIGPIWPVQPPTPPPTPCAVYQARKIMVYNSDRTELVKQVDIDCQGFYRVELKAGIYTVDINRIGIDRSREVPKQIEIKPGFTVKLDIDIDTGIR